MSRCVIRQVGVWAVALAPWACSGLTGQVAHGALLQASDPTPANGATEVTTPLLLWVPGQTAFRHVLYLGTDPNALERLATLPASQVFYNLWPGLAPGQTYYWRVDEIESSGRTISGMLWSFTTLGLTASRPQPEDGSPYEPLDLTLAWTAGATATSHRVYLGTDRTAVAAANATWPELIATVLSPQTTCPVRGLNQATAYYWRVDEVELDGRIHQGQVWSFTTLPPIPVSDPNLVAWWTLDEAVGQVAVDWSGHDHHGTIHGGRWAAGQTGTAIELDGTASFVEAPGHGVPLGSDVFSMAAWIQPYGAGQDQTILGWGLDASNQGNRLELQGERLCHRFVENDYEVQVGDLAGEWVHVTLVHTGSGRRALYLNGTPQEGSYVGPTVAPNVHSTGVGIGAAVVSGPERFFEGLIDDVRVYGRVLTPLDVAGLIRTDPLAAWNPDPGDWTVVDGLRTSALTWSAGEGAVAHEVYLGTAPSAVAQGTPSRADVFRGRMITNSYALAQSLTPDQVYYWRVDECQSNGTVHQGPLWRFTAARYLTVDDFESYTDQSPDRLFETWWDGMGYASPPPGHATNGTGSVTGHPDPPYVEQAIVHSGHQSMPLYFDNTRAPFHSVVERRFDAPQDWSTGGTLTLYLYGDPASLVSDSDVLYVGIEDGVSRTALTAWDGASQTPLGQPVWTRWDIPLSTFQRQGVALAQVQWMRIGIGQKDGPAGGNGLVFIDDIRLNTGQ